MSSYLRIYKTFIFIIIISCFQCTENTDNNNLEKLISDSIKKTDLQNLNSSNTSDIDELEHIRGKSVLFFSLDKEEYNSFLIRMGKGSKWEFDVIYNNFKRIAENAQEPLKNINIKSSYTTKKNVAFITARNDTLYFNRAEEDYFVGQIFFDGKDSLNIVEGLFKADKLEEMIVDFFNIKKDFNISKIVHISDSFRYIKPDTTLVEIEDTIQ